MEIKTVDIILQYLQYLTNPWAKLAILIAGIVLSSLLIREKNAASKAPKTTSPSPSKGPGPWQKLKSWFKMPDLSSWKGLGNWVLAGVAIALMGYLLTTLFPPLWPWTLAAGERVWAKNPGAVLLVGGLIAATLAFNRKMIVWTLVGAVSVLALLAYNDQGGGVYRKYADERKLMTRKSLEQIVVGEQEIACQLIVAPGAFEGKWSEAIKDPKEERGKLSIKDLRISFKNLGVILERHTDGSYVLGQSDGSVLQPADGSRMIEFGSEEKVVLTKGALNPGGKWKSLGKECLIRVAFHVDPKSKR